MPTSSRPDRSRARQIGMLLGIIALAGLWLSALRTERSLGDELDGALARHAAAYLLVVTPAAADGSVDAPRLVSSANTIASASFWPGGFQMTRGNAPLVADTIGLLPLPDSTLALLDRRASTVIASHARYRVAIVPVPKGAGEGAQGWAAAWGALPPRLPSPLALYCTLLALGSTGATLVMLRREPDPRWRVMSVVVAFGCLAMVALVLGGSVRHAARTATSLRLLTTRRLVEIAATAVGVKQARLPEIAAGLEVRETEGPVSPGDDIERATGPGGPAARIVAATPRNQGGLEIRVVPYEARLGPFWRSLLLWVVTGTAGLGIIAWAAGLSGLDGLFHSARGGSQRGAREGSGRG